MSQTKNPVIAEFTDFRHYLREYILCQPRKGHGFKLKIADALNVHPTLITQILNDKKILFDGTSVSFVSVLKIK